MPIGVGQWSGAAGYVLPRPEAGESQSVRERNRQRTQSFGGQLLRAAASQCAGLRGIARSIAVCPTPLPALCHRAHKPCFLLTLLLSFFWTGPLTSGCSNIPAMVLAAADVSELIENWCAILARNLSFFFFFKSA